MARIMNGPLARRISAVFLIALATAGCSTTATLEAQTAPTPEAGEATDLEALYWQRVQDARTFTQADVDYMTGMIGHHAQALILADMAPRNGASGAVLRLASRIDNAQKDEIESMQRWLRQRGQPVPTVHVEGTKLTIRMEGAPEPAAGGMDHSGMASGEMNHEGMDHGAMGHGGMDHMNMPGMLSQAQLDELDAARGPAFDRLFLRYMIQHHGGAVTMTDDLFTKDGAAQDDAAFKLASDIQVDQRTEIARMQRMLDALPDSD